MWLHTCSAVVTMRNRTTTVDQAAQYRSALLAERARVTSGNENGKEILVIPGSVAVEDQAPLMHDQFVVLRQHGMERRKLKLIDAALERLNKGEFGTCDDCGQRIPDKRLKAVPWAAYCVRCQNWKDRRDEADADDLEMIA